jgi:uncharacterized protein YukE
MYNRGFRDQAALTCWKDIAKYLGKGVRTVQRWEHELELPVKRPKGGGSKGPVAAATEDLDKWLSSRWSGRGTRYPGGRQHHLDSDVLLKPPLIGTWQTIETARKLRQQNQALLNELMSSLSQLQLTCQRSAAREFPSPGNIQSEAAHSIPREVDHHGLSHSEDRIGSAQ